MAYLLGSLSSIESLLEDVYDLQSVISEYESHLGPLNCPSWKYPDKQASDVNIDELISQYTSYFAVDSNQDEDNDDAKQVAHISLYELVIDRMVYLLHASGKFIIPLIKSINRPNNSSPLDFSRDSSGRNSVGLVVKQCWNLQKVLQACVSQLVAELNQKLEEKEHYSKDSSCSTPLSACPSSVTTKEKPKFQSQTSVPLSPDGSIKTDISRDECFKSSQTVETSFVSCEACSVVQESLRQTAKVVSSMCRDLNLPSRLSRFMSTFDSTKWMTANEVMHWTTDQNKDLSIICRHFENTFEPLKASVESLEKKCSSLENQKKMLEKKNFLEIETQETLQKQARSKLQETIKSHQIKMNEIMKEKEELESQVKNLTEKLVFSQEELQKVKNTSKQNETEIKQLTEKLTVENNFASEVERLNQEIETLKIKAEDSQTKFQKCCKELKQEEAKAKSMSQHFESIQTKQRSTLNHVEKLNDENTDLQNQLAELQDLFDENQQQVQTLRVNQQQLQQKIDDNEKKIEMFSIQKEKWDKTMQEMKIENQNLSEELKKLEERENLLIQYPDLNGPILDECQCSGNVMHDMEIQIKANILRIELLERQNETLRVSLKKVKEKYKFHPNNFQLNFQPVSLWSKDTIQTLATRDSKASGEPGLEFISNHLLLKTNEKIIPKAKNEEFSTTVSLKEKTSTKPIQNSLTLIRSKTASIIHNDKNSLRDMEHPNRRSCKSSSIRTYISLKQQGKIPNNNAWELRGKSSSIENKVSNKMNGPNQKTQQLMFVCKRCDKMYLEAKELKIHSLYCTNFVKPFVMPPKRSLSLGASNELKKKRKILTIYEKPTSSHLQVIKCNLRFKSPEDRRLSISI